MDAAAQTEETEDMETTMTDALRVALANMRFEVKGGATFAVDTRANDRGSCNVELNTHGEYHETETGRDERRDVIGSVELKIYGEYAYGDTTDRSARVVIRHHFRNAMTHAYVKADRWNNSRRTYEPMPEGGRVKVAAAVLAMVEGVATDGDAWRTIAREETNSAWRHEVESYRSDAMAATKRADEVEARGAQHLPIAGDPR